MPEDETDTIDADVVSVIKTRSYGGFKVYKANELPPWGVCMALYGAPGVGKTTLAAGAADSSYGSPAVMFDIEGGARSVQHKANLDVIPFEKWPDLSRIVRDVIKDDPPPWKTIIIDNMSEIQASCLRSITGTASMPEIQDYGQATALLLSFTRALRDYARAESVNVIFIAWENPEKDEQTGRIKRDVGFTPSLARQFPGIVDIVGYLTVEDNPPTYSRLLSFAPDPRTAAKFRRSDTEKAAQIPLTISYKKTDPLMADLLATLKGGEAWPKERYPERVRRGAAAQQQQTQEATK